MQAWLWALGKKIGPGFPVRSADEINQIEDRGCATTAWVIPKVELEEKIADGADGADGANGDEAGDETDEKKIKEIKINPQFINASEPPENAKLPPTFKSSILKPCALPYSAIALMYQHDLASHFDPCAAKNRTSV